MNVRRKRSDKMSEEDTTIRVSKKLRNELAKLGNKDDDFEDILWRLIKRSKD